MLWAVEFDSDMTPEVITACNNAGLLLTPMRPNTVRLMPVESITKELINTLEGVMNNIQKLESDESVLKTV